MRSTRFRLQLAAFLFILLPATAGVVAVHASATCEKFVRTYVTRPVRNRVSKATADAWAAWRVAHPNWRPNPNVHRPKYVMTRDEQMKKVEQACAVPTFPAQETVLFTPERVDPPPAILPPHMETETVFPTLPTQVAEVISPPIATFVPPPPIPIVQVSSGAPGPTPEPMSLLLVLSGLAGLGLLVRSERTRLPV